MWGIHGSAGCLEEEMNMLLIEYPKCSTCKKAKKWLEDQGCTFETRHMVEQNPTKEELRGWVEKSGYPIRRFFNTSGIKYRELKLSEKLSDMSEEEQLELLSSDGMLVKRPLLITEKKICVGFKEKEWEAMLHE